ncbi:MAG: ORF6N domain-containing protein [Pyrinomonadaceae bacterium]|nr:ORF6N domain-containing protein [Pyrinomonadaceae bacterium]
MNALIPLERVESRILFIRGEKVIVDSDLAQLYGVTTSNFNKAVKRNIERFPSDFMFQLTKEEFESLRFQTGISNESMRSQFATSKERGGRRYLPYAFTEHGALMAANILNSDRAVEASVQVVRAFVKLRQMLASNAELARKVEALEQKYAANFKVVFDAIKQLMAPPTSPNSKIGFLPTKKKK